MKKYVAEMIGTFSLVLFGCGAAVVSGISTTGPSGVGLLGIALAFGLAVVVMAYAIGPITGCHINPAITVSMLIAGKIKGGDAVGYIIGQFVGAILGSGVLYFSKKGLPGFARSEWALGATGRVGKAGGWGRV